MKLSGIGHVALPVSDLDNSTKWYTEVLGGQVHDVTGVDHRDQRAERTKQVRIQIGATIVNLAEGAPVHRDVLNHFFHYSFSANPDEMDSWISHLSQLGIEVLGPYGHGGASSVSLYFDDPDNYRMELNFLFADYNTAKQAALSRGGKLGNPSTPYEWD